VPPLFGLFGHLLSGTAQSGDTLGCDNAALAANPTQSRPFGLRLPGPFQPRASTGSHLPRLSELRLGLY